MTQQQELNALVTQYHPISGLNRWLELSITKHRCAAMDCYRHDGALVARPGSSAQILLRHALNMQRILTLRGTQHAH